MAATNADAAKATENKTTGKPHEFESFEEFWPYYVAMHSQPATRLFHAVGTLAGAGVALTGLLRGRMLAPLKGALIGYGTAWAAHWLLERNNPATFGYPAWSAQGDLQMLSMQLQGRDHELTEIGRKWLADHPEDRSPGSIALEEEVA
jgi:hypothetical protein